MNSILLERAEKRGKDVDWVLRARRAMAMSKIDYGCDFIDGVCKTERRSKKPRVACCCSACADSKGYLDVIPPGTKQFYINRFDKKDGFWRKDKGCILPRVFRSVTCLQYTCSHSGKIHRTFRFLAEYPRHLVGLDTFDDLTRIEGRNIYDTNKNKFYFPGLEGRQRKPKSIDVVSMDGKIINMKTKDLFTEALR